MNTPELLLMPEEKRTNLFPIRYTDLWDLYKTALSCIWVAGEVDLSKDKEDWEKLTDDERHFVSMVLAFFAQADGIVNDNLAERFGLEVQVREAKCFYDLQKTMENIHSEMYSLLIETYVDDEARRDSLFHAIDHFPCVAKKATWAQTWISSTTASFAERLIAFAIVEGVFFSGSFCAIFWLKTRGVMPGLCASNLLISRDERMHQDFAAHLYRKHVAHKLKDEVVRDMFRDAVAHEKEFVSDALPVSLIGMNADAMATYIEFVADRLLQQLGHPVLFGAVCPFDFMMIQGLATKSNFFETRETTYQKSGARATSGERACAFDAAF